MGLVGQASCSATIEADMRILDVLNTPQFQAIKRSHPALGPTSLTSFALVMAERLILANRMIAVLPR
jgi:hypothetical protein